MSLILPLGPLHLLTAERTAAGLFDIPSNVQDDVSSREWDNTRNVAPPKPSPSSPSLSGSPVITSCHLPTLERRQTMSGNIVVMTSTTTTTPDENNNDVTTRDSTMMTPCAFWLQRKLGKTHHGWIRLGYQLKQQQQQQQQQCVVSSAAATAGGKWELDTDALGRQILVAIYILPSSILDVKQKPIQSNTNDRVDTTDDDVVLGTTANAYSPLNELSALQRIANHSPHHYQYPYYMDSQQQQHQQKKHVVGTNLVATSSQHVYAVLPYYRDGTLLQFCQMVVGPLPEPLARYLFRQIVKGLKTLQDVELCHRNLSLEAIEREGDHVDICQLGWALRYTETMDGVDKEDWPIPPPSVGLLNPLNYNIPPEYFGPTRGVWNGFRTDLWAAGLMLYSMVIGSDALFTAPIVEDKTFCRLCIKGNIRSQAKRYGKLVKKDFSGLSDELMDLLKHMLRADPERRLSLDQVMVHPWLITDEVMTPTEWIEQNRPHSSFLIGGEE